MGVSTIGPGVGVYDYTTVSLWEAATDDLSGAGVVEGHIMESVTDTALVDFDGTSSDSSNYRLLKSDPGNGWNESGSVAVSKDTAGIRWTMTQSWNHALATDNENYLKVKNLIVELTGTNSAGIRFYGTSGCTGNELENLILVGPEAIIRSRPTNIVHNCYVIQTKATPNFCGVNWGSNFVNCLFMNTAAAGDTGTYVKSYGTPLVHNTGSDGAWSAGWDDTGDGDYNASYDTNAPGANSLNSVTLSNAVENISTDLRPKSGGDYDGAGLVQTGFTTDVFGVARAAVGEACTIGPAEVAAAATPIYYRRHIGFSYT